MYGLRLKQLIKQAARNIGYEVIRGRGSAPARIVRLLSQLDVSLVLDVGANIGQYATALRQHGYTGEIVSFEPQADAHKYLTRASAADPRWTVAPRLALGDREGTVEINVSENSSSSSLLNMHERHISADPASRYTRRELVPMARLDTIVAEIIKSTSHFFLKMDVQGYEDRVLRGAQGIMANAAGIQAELSLVPLYAGAPTFEEMLSLLSLAGFEVFDFEPGFFHRSSGRLLQLDGVFIRRDML